MKFTKAPRQGQVIAELETAIRLAMRQMEKKSMSGLSNLWEEISKKMKGELATEYRGTVHKGEWNLEIARRTGLLFRMERIVYRHMYDFKRLAIAYIKSQIHQHYDHEYYTAAYILDVTTPPNVHIKINPMLREADVTFSTGPVAWAAWHTRFETWATAWESAFRANLLLNAVNSGIPDDVMSEVDATRIGTPAVTFWDAVSRLLITTLLQVQAGARNDLRDLNNNVIEDEIWQTREDERVCDECGPLEGLTREQVEDEEPPLHPRCRCFWRVMPKAWIDLADRELAHEMDIHGLVPDGMYIRDEKGEVKAAMVVSFNVWAEDKIIASGRK